MSPSHPSRRYREVQVNTAAKDDLLLLLLDGGVRFSEAGLQELQKGDEQDPGHRSDQLIRAQRIVLELMSALSPAIGLELFNNLQDLYRFTFSRLFEGNVGADAQLVQAGVTLMHRIRDIWKEAVEQARAERDSGPEKPQSNSTISVEG